MCQNIPRIHFSLSNKESLFIDIQIHILHIAIVLKTNSNWATQAPNFQASTITDSDPIVDNGMEVFLLYPL